MTLNSGTNGIARQVSQNAIKAPPDREKQGKPNHVREQKPNLSGLLHRLNLIIHEVLLAALLAPLTGIITI